jgi:class 3 adenylate cyclase/tetratricopeptide (TPR) repeat protein
VSVCPSCGHRYRAGAKFCAECGAALGQVQPLAQTERKIVTVLFADLVGFTSRAEQLDPEDVRAVLSPYYARLRTELERFGGTVEKFIGDAVMALFGAPAAHEDDPERAVRAALAIRDWVREEDQIQLRVAVNTGEALITLDARPGQGEGMAAGDVVNTAARLQAAAPVNGVLVGERTFRATRAVIEYRQAAPVAAKGKRGPVPVWEALDARARLGMTVPVDVRTALVGRDRELGLLGDALARVRAERTPQLVTLVGVPGAGKSRLLYELSQIAGAETGLINWRQGRSLSYGDGISFWALAEMVKAQAGILDSDTSGEAQAKLAQMTADVLGGTPEADWVAGHLTALAGLGSGRVQAGRDARGEVFAAWRCFFEALAGAGPVALVFEDLHWADDGLLDFVDYLVDSVGDVPMLVVGSARPELLARRPGWGGGKPNAMTLTLAPLSRRDTARLIGSLLGVEELEAGQQTAVLDHAGGNPLFAEQYAQMQTEQGSDHRLPVPESVQAIIAARLDLLARPEKQLLQDAAVIGKVFWTGAVTALGGISGRTRSGGERGGTGPVELLRGLERKQFVRRERASLVAGQTEYAFTHVLVRDVAYGQIPRAVRAGRHAAAASWIEALGRPGDHAEMLAYHYLAALDLARAASQDTADLAPRARTALRQAGDRALALNALAAAAGYYRAALALWPQGAHQQRADLLRLLGTVLLEIGELDQAEAALAEGAQAAAEGGLPAVQSRIRVLLADVRNFQGARIADTLAECEAAAAVMDAENDLDGLSEALTRIGTLRFWHGDVAGGQAALERAITCAQQCGNHRAQMRASHWLAVTFVDALFIPVPAATARAEQLLQTASGDPWAEADMLKPLCLLYAYLGRSADARAALARSQQIFTSLGAKFALAESAIPAGLVGLAIGDPAGAERSLRQGYEAFRAMGERGYVFTIGALLAEALYAQGRLAEVQQVLGELQIDPTPDAIDAHVGSLTKAKLLARRGQFAAARQLVNDEEAAYPPPTASPRDQAWVHETRAEVDRLAGAPERAAASLRAALRIYEDRGATALADRVRAVLADLASQPSAKSG